LSEDSDKRLKAIKEFTEFGSGFRVAMRDLEIRGAGSVLGEVQHGHFEQVGFDMYNELLNETIKELRGEKVEEEVDVQLEINVSSYIPDDYIDNSSIKISIYQDIAYCTNDEDIQNITDEIIDRFGTFPPEVENLLKVAKIKVLCREKNIYKISERNSGILFFFDKEKFNIEIIDKLMKKYRNKIKFSPSQQMPYITLSGVDENNKLQHIKEFLQEL
jgi:transcription-repair coupling factor (superfamily II helicase)